MYIYICIKTGKKMKLDVGTESFIQNTLKIFSLTLLYMQIYIIYFIYNSLIYNIIYTYIYMYI